MQIVCTQEAHTFGGPGIFYLGKAEELEQQLLAAYRGKVRLIYLDPPFRTGEAFTMKIGQGRNAEKITLYEDVLTTEEYVAWMRRVLTLCHAMLDAKGSVYVHLDYRMSARIRLLLDEIFGEANFMNEIIWPYKTGGRSKRYFPRKHDTILFYRKSKQVYFNIAAVGVPRGAERRNHMKRFIDEDGRVGYSIRSNGKLYKYYEDSLIYPADVWGDVEHLQQKDRERTGYATQKPEALLKRIILASSQEGDLVMDLFSGSGTTAAVAVKNGRRFAVADSSPVAAYILRKRLLAIAGAPDLFDAKERALSFVYPASDTRAEIAYTTGKRKGERVVKISALTFDDKPAMPVYAALGSVKGDTFHAVQTNCSPKLPLTFVLSDKVQNVVQAADAFGHQAFFTIEE